MIPARRRAISTPREGMPARMTEPSSGFRSTISCAMRRSARAMASASNTGGMAWVDEAGLFGDVVTDSLATSRDRIKGKGNDYDAVVSALASFIRLFRQL